MKLGAMADACHHQLQTAEAAALGFEERFGLLVDAEWTAREQRKLQRRLRTDKLRHPATLEAVDFTHPRRLNARLLTRLAKLDLLAIDDWMIAPLRDAERCDLTEVIEDRAERASTPVSCP